jgi:hypothetical protein
VVEAPDQLSELRGTVVVGTALTVAGEVRTSDGTVLPVSALPTGPASSSETADAAHRMGLDSTHETRILEEPLTRDELSSALGEPVWGLFFAGHGHPEGIVLARPGGVEILPAAELARMLREAGVSVVVLAACDTATAQPSHDATDLNGSWPPHVAEQLARAGVPYVLGMDGPIADSQAMAFTSQFFEGLAVHGSVSQAVEEARAAMTTGWWQPVVYARRDAPRRLDVPRRAFSPPASLQACHVPPNWQRNHPQPLPGSGRPARMDVLWCLDRGPVRGVLVESDPEASAWAFAVRLDEVERGPLRPPTSSSAADDPLPWRRWFAVRSPWREPAGDHKELAATLVRPDWLRPALAGEPGGRRIGLVVPFFAERDQPVRAIEYAQAVAVLYPGAAVIVQVHGPRQAALPSAVEIAAGLPRLRPDGSDLGVAILMRTNAAAPANPTPEPALPVDPLEAAMALFDRRRAAVAEGQHDPWPNHAVKLLRYWDQSSAHGPGGSAADRWDQEFQQLLDLALSEEIDRRLFHAVVSEHARSRPDPLRSASLLLVSGDDELLGAWLDAAESAGRPVDPRVLPPRDWSPVLLAELRRAREPGQAEAVARRWAGHLPSTLPAVVDHLARPGRGELTPARRSAEDVAFLLRLADPAACEAALRAGVGEGVTLLDIPPGDPPALAWPLLSRRPLDAPTVARLQGWSMALRRLLGFTRDPVERDPEVRDRVAAYHAALRPWHWSQQCRPGRGPGRDG